MRRLIVYDDASEDGTLDYLASRIHQCPGSYVLHDEGGLGSPVAVMADYLERHSAGADWFAKVDNDIAMPAGWLDETLKVAGTVRDEFPLDLLGLAAGWTGDNRKVGCGWEHTSHIGGVGLMRVGAFEGRPLGWEGRQGFTQWQHAHPIHAGWIIPDVQAVQLDLVPAEPYAELSEMYIELGWQRRWPPYAGEADHWKWVVE